MKWALIAIVSLVVIALCVVAIGWLQPVKHTVTRQATFHVSPDRLFALISDVERYPAWRSSTKSVHKESPTRFRELSDNGDILYDVEVSEPNSRRITRIADKSLPFGGTWTYRIVPVDGGSSTLHITEDGEVYNPLFRFVSRFIMGHSSTIDSYLRDAGKAYKETAIIS